MKRALYSAISVFVLTFMPSFARADSYKWVRGEGNRLHVEISLDQSNNVRLEMSCHSSNFVAKTYELGVQIFVADKSRVSPEVEKLRKVPEGTSKKLDICTNDDCRTYTWEYCDGCGSDQTGGPLMTDISIDRGEKKIRSVRLIVPNDDGRYEYRGDFSSVLNRLCR